MTLQQELDQPRQQDLVTNVPASRSSFFLHRARRGLQILWVEADFFVMLLLLVFVAYYYLALKLPLPVREIELFDTSWELDLVAKTQHGLWLGRDLIFTRGPLFQWLLSSGPLRHGLSLGSFYLYLWVTHYWTTIPAMYATGRLLLHRQSSWVRVFFLLLMLIFWLPVHWIIFNIKVLFPFFSFAVLLRTFPARGLSLSGISWRAALTASLLAISFLLSDDSGFYSAAAFIVVLAAFLLYEHNSVALRTTAKYIALIVSFFLVWVLATNWATSRLLDFHFWKAAYEVATQYRWSENMLMQPQMVPIFWLGVGLNTLVFAGHWLIRRKTPGLPARAGASQLAMLGFALIGVQLILVCSEKLHVATGLWPWIAISCALLLGATENRLSDLRLTVSVILILVFTAALSGPNHLFIPRNLFQDRSALTSSHGCPSGLQEVDGVCLKTTQSIPLQAVHDFLLQHSRDSDSIGIFPYQSTYAFVARRNTVGELLQHYISSGDYLNHRQMQSLEQARPSWAMYGAEPWQSIQCNGLTNFTRNPNIWFYWQRWYKDDFDVVPGLQILQRDEERGKHWQMSSTPMLPQPLQGRGTDEITLPANSLGDDLDFVQIDVRVEYPLWWKLFRPATLVVKIQFENGDEKIFDVIAQPNHPYEIWIYPWDQAQLANYFSASAKQWRSGVRPRIQSLSLLSQARDWIAVQPSRITMQDVHSVKLSEQ